MAGLVFIACLSGITACLDVPVGDPGQLWQMPAYEGYEPIDLADPSVVIGPGSIDQAHTVDEWIDVEQLRQAAEIYYRFCANP